MGLGGGGCGEEKKSKGRMEKALGIHNAAVDDKGDSDSSSSDCLRLGLT